MSSIFSIFGLDQKEVYLFMGIPIVVLLRIELHFSSSETTATPLKRMCPPFILGIHWISGQFTGETPRDST